MPKKSAPEPQPELLDQEPQALVVPRGDLTSFNVAEIDQQVATAKRYPRSVATFQRTAHSMATLDQPTAERCLYVLKRGNKAIQGPSARFAEIVLTSWGNCRAGAAVVDVGDTFVEAEGFFHDLQNNVALKARVRRRITDRDGKRYSEDMIVVTGNAACSIALRNAVLKGVPQAFWHPIYEQALKVIAGTSKDIKRRLQDTLDDIKKRFHVEPERVYKALGVKGPADIGTDELVTLKGIVTAIDEGDTSAQEAFGGKGKPTPPPEQAEGGHGLNEGQDQQIRSALYRASKDGGVTMAEFCDHFGIKDTKDLPAAKMNEALKWIADPIS